MFAASVFESGKIDTLVELGRGVLGVLGETSGSGHILGCRKHQSDPYRERKAESAYLEVIV